MAIVSKASRVAAAGRPFFKCPNCEALYHIVKVEADPQSVDREIACRACGGPLPAREAKFVMKYFLLRKASRVQKWKRK
jgi:DNA-directed RNA polymerase subunit RPC12/RpoP